LKLNKNNLQVKIEIFFLFKRQWNSYIRVEYDKYDEYDTPCECNSIYHCFDSLHKPRIEKYKARGFHIYKNLKDMELFEQAKKIKMDTLKIIRVFPNRGIEYFEAQEHFKEMISKMQS